MSEPDYNTKLLIIIILTIFIFPVGISLALYWGMLKPIDLIAVFILFSLIFILFMGFLGIGGSTRTTSVETEIKTITRR